MPTAIPHPSQSSSPSLVLACDLGGTRLKLALVRGGDLLARRELPAEPNLGLRTALETVLREQKSLGRPTGLNSTPIAAFALAFPGIVHPQSGRILSTPSGKFDDAESLDVAALMACSARWPTFICNDANAALAGEWQYGAARHCGNVVMMTLGTGVGSSVIVEGRALRGAHGQAGCLGGHLLANVDGSECQCGALGCVETEASTWCLDRRARAHPAFRQSALATQPILDFEAVFRLAEANDAVAIDLRERSVRTWAAAAVSLIHAYDPEILVLGGGIMRSGGWILPRLEAYVARHAWTPWGRVQVVPARLGNDAGLLGAAWLAHRESTRS